MMAPCRCRSWRTRLLVSRRSSRSERAPTVEVMAGRVAVVRCAVAGRLASAKPRQVPAARFSTFLAPVRVPQCRRQGSVIRNRDLAAAKVVVDSSAASCCGTPFAATPGSAFSAASISTRRSSCDVLPHEFLKTRLHKATLASGLRCRSTPPCGLSRISRTTEHPGTDTSGSSFRLGVPLMSGCRVRLNGGCGIGYGRCDLGIDRQELADDHERDSAGSGRQAWAEAR